MKSIGAAALAVLREWLPADDDPVRPLMQLATVDADGRPDVRSVLLSAWGADGFVFHTDGRSRKATDIGAQPAVALVVGKPQDGRQLTVQGVAEPAGADRDTLAYARRSPYLRRLAWVNTAELAQAERDARTAAWRLHEREHEDGALDPPATWIGFLVRPTRLTFWSADPEGPSHRVEFQQDADGWTARHLPG